MREYLPPEIDEKELSDLVDQAVKDTGAKEIKDMGKVMGIVKEKVGNKADGSRIAEMVKAKLQ